MKSSWTVKLARWLARPSNPQLDCTWEFKIQLYRTKWPTTLTRWPTSNWLMSGSILERIYILDHLLYLLTLLLNVIEIFKILLRENIRSMKNAYEIVLILSTTANKLRSGWFIWCDISLQYYIIVNLYIYINWITLQQYYITMFGALVRVRLFWFQTISGYHFTPYRVSGCAWKIEFSRKAFHLTVK